MQKLMMLAALVAGVLLTFPMPSGAAPMCTVNDAGQTTCVVNWQGHGSPTDCNASDEAFTTIQKAVDFLATAEGRDYPPTGRPARIILVYPGLYNTGELGGARVNIGINALKIVSTEGPQVTKISAADFHYGIIINAHIVTIEGFTIVGGMPPPNDANDGIFVYGGHGNKILNNVVRDTRTLSIAICSSGNLVSGNIVHDNHGDGIVLGDIAPLPNMHQACEGVAVFANTANVITNNTVSNNSRYGIVVWSSADEDVRFSGIGNSVVHNTVHDNRIGIAISPPETTSKAERTYVEANSVHDNDIEIIDQGTLTTCTGNNIQDKHAGTLPQGACASEDNQLAYIRGQ